MVSASIINMSKRLHHIMATICILIGMGVLVGCKYKLKPFDEVESDTLIVKIHRYDRMESLFLTTGDFSALQQMSTDYPNETRTLIEKILHIGKVDDPEINNKLLAFYQDSTLQAIITEAELQYANVDDLNRQLTDAFHTLKSWIPNFKVPLIYTQICALDQSIVVGDESVGICLDKYLGEKYPLYAKYYDSEQRKMMKREYIVPDFICFYLLSLYPPPLPHETSQNEMDIHMGKAQWLVNKVMGKHMFKSIYIEKVGAYMAKHPHTSVDQLMKSNGLPIMDN